MIDDIVDRIVSRSRDDASDDTIAVLKYGYTVMIEMMLIILISIGIGALMNCLVELIIFSLSFILLRTFGGGYHARTAKGCIIMSAMMTLLFCVGIKTIDRIYVPMFASSILVFIITMISYIPMSAVGDETVERRCLLITKITFPILMILSVVIYLFTSKTYGTSVLVGEAVWLLSANIERLKHGVKFRKSI